jgi:hypothetical protein
MNQSSKVAPKRPLPNRPEKKEKKEKERQMQ